MKNYYNLYRQIKCSQCPDYMTEDARSCSGSNTAIKLYCTWVSEDGLLEKELTKKFEELIE